MRKKIVAGNWKMNTDLQEAKTLASEIVNMAKDEVRGDVTLILCPPFPFLRAVSDIAGSANAVFTGAQNCHEEEKGAYTGEISTPMLASMGVQYVIIGHSERREYFGESHDLLAKKTVAALASALTPIFCCGEKLETREEGRHFQRVQHQIETGLFEFSAHEMQKMVVAYEPVWAIGTGVTARAEQAQEMHAHIRKLLADKYGQETPDKVPILYGGSVKPANAGELFAQPDVDGGLVGGASLKSRDFIDIAQSF